MMMPYFSRRTFILAVGGVVASGSLLGMVRRFMLRPPARAEHPTIPGCCTYAEYDGWLVMAADVTRLRRTVVYGSGWHQWETARSRIWRWSQQTATVSFPNPREDTVFQLGYAGRPSYFANAPRTATVSINDRVLHSFVVDVAGQRQLSVLLSETDLGDDDVTEVQIAVDRTFVPAVLRAESQDRRELGILVRYASIEPALPQRSP